MLKYSADNTVELLKKELQIRMNELHEAWHMSSLEKIFIENRIYHDIEECETWPSVIETIDKGLDPFKKLLLREVTEEDIVKLTEIKIKRMAKFDAFKGIMFFKYDDCMVLPKYIQHALNLKGFNTFYQIGHTTYKSSTWAVKI